MRVKVAIPDALAAQDVTELRTVFPPVIAKFPVAELLVEGTLMLNSAVFPFSEICRVSI